MRVHSQLRKVYAVEVQVAEVGEDGVWAQQPFAHADSDGNVEMLYLDNLIAQERLTAMRNEEGLIFWVLDDVQALPGDWIVWEDGQAMVVKANVFAFLFNYRPN